MRPELVVLDPRVGDARGSWLRYTKSTGLWAIYWRDRNLKFHEYNRKRPTKNLQALLDHIETSGDPIFWG